MFGTVAILGVGLIGGSIGRTLRTRGLAARVVGIGRDEVRLREAVELGVLDAATTDVEEGVSDAEVAVVCTPVTRIVSDLRLAAAFGSAGLLLTDAGSTKAAIVAAAERDRRTRARFVAAHPIAGSERKGAAHAQANLFDGRACVLTPTPQTPTDRIDRAHRFWTALGCTIHLMDPEAHDQALALTSHLPHAVAAALAGSVPTELLGLAAGAYRDGTRVAGSDAALWAGIFRDNRQPTLEALTAFEVQIAQFRRFLEADDEAGLIDWWTEARARRDRFAELGKKVPGGTVTEPGWKSDVGLT